MMIDAPATPTTTVELPRFGTCTYAESDVLVFPWGVPGFGGLHKFLPLTRDGQERVVWLQSLDDLKVALPTVDPYYFFQDYEPKLPSFAMLSLDIKRAEDMVLLAICVIPVNGEMTVNLLAPVVVNLEKKVGRQVPLEGTNYDVRTPVPTRTPSGATGE